MPAVILKNPAVVISDSCLWTCSVQEMDLIREQVQHVVSLLMWSCLLQVCTCSSNKIKTLLLKCGHAVQIQPQILVWFSQSTVPNFATLVCSIQVPVLSRHSSVLEWRNLWSIGMLNHSKTHSIPYEIPLTQQINYTRKSTSKLPIQLSFQRIQCRLKHAKWQTFEKPENKRQMYGCQLTQASLLYICLLFLGFANVCNFACFWLKLFWNLTNFFKYSSIWQDSFVWSTI